MRKRAIKESPKKRKRAGQTGTGKDSKVVTTGISHKYTVEGSYQNVKEFCKKANKALRGDGKIVTGADLDDLEYRRRRTWIPAVDWITNDGLIEGSACQIWGRYRNGKTYLLFRLIANLQRQKVACMIGSIERFDRAWARQVGIFVEFTSKEMDNFDAKKRKKADRYNRFFYDQGIPPLTLALHSNSVRVLDLAIEAVRANVFGLIGIDSLGGVMDASNIEDESVGKQGYGGQSNIFTNFSKQTFNAIHRKYDADGVMSPTGDFPNRTSVVCLNQARMTIGTKAHAEEKVYHPTGGEALKHLWEQEIFCKAGEEMSGTYQYKGKTRRDVYARVIELKGTKMKGSPEQKLGDMWMSLKAHEDENGRVWRPGQANDVTTLRAIAVQVGVITGQGVGLLYRGEKYRGKPAIEKAMFDDRKMYEQMYNDMIEVSEKESLSREIPEVWEF